MTRLFYAITAIGILGMICGMFSNDGTLALLGAATVFAGGIGMLIYGEIKA